MATARLGRYSIDWSSHQYDRKKRVIHQHPMKQLKIAQARRRKAMAP
jgi:hypothetical protein